MTAQSNEGDGDVITGDYVVFDDRPDPRRRFQHKPASVVMIATLELVIDDGRSKYLLITSPRYEPVERASEGVHVESGQWTPPYVTRSIASPAEHYWRSAGKVMESVDQELVGWDAAMHLSQMVGGWNCGLSELEQIGSFTEYKRSWGQPTSWKAYHVLLFRARTDDVERMALADPEARKGFFYLPIEEDRFAHATRTRQCEQHARDEIMFLGQPLATNLAHIVGTPEKRKALCAQSVSLREEDFHSTYSGLLVCGDIAGYGAACKHVADMQSLEAEARDPATIIRESAAAGFTQLFHEAGMRQIHTAGDGFIAALPLQSESEIREALMHFLEAYERFLHALDELNTRIAADFIRVSGEGDPPVMGSRLALHWGEYRYGKIARAASSAPTFDGATIIDVARLEQGLSAMTKGKVEDPVGVSARPHTVIQSQALIEHIPHLHDCHERLEALGSADVGSKEFAHEASLLAWNLP